MNTNDFDEIGFRDTVERHWKYHRTCRHRLWKTTHLDGSVTQLEVAPPLQQILGGDQDGLNVWTAFEMNLTDFLSEPGIEINEVGFRSYCIECTPNPFVGIKGKYKGHQFILMIHLQPIADSKPVEIIDTINDQTRAIKRRQP